MSDTLTVTIWPTLEAVAEDEPTTYHEIDYVSLVSGDTYGPPALVAPAPKAAAGTKPRARKGDKVLYINTRFVPLFEIERDGEED
jgi:hypothetical protein